MGLFGRVARGVVIGTTAGFAVSTAVRRTGLANQGKSIDVVGLVYIKNRKMLNARSKGKALFYVPGGKRVDSETDEQALTREIKEELNVDLIPSSMRFIGKFVAQADGEPDGVTVSMSCYFGDFTGEPKPSSEIEEIAFFSYFDLEKMPAAGKKVLNYLKVGGLID